MLILKSCRCNPPLLSTYSRSNHGPCWWSVVHHCNPSPTQLKKLAKTRPTDRPMVCGLCKWIEAPFTQPLMQTTADQHGPSFNLRSVGLTVGEGQQPIRGKLLSGSTSDCHNS
ncbi:hypothetical protein MTR67_001256 [Solanum verrucosum]|uniref:Uncharacterized protein n=1 Tax=Solanum verrucosum TaxID=315347 RepID=A0AAF0PSG3_SOLVR|nr:hypothetical protein MTR67_001256 [Solanum verrucosum]